MNLFFVNNQRRTLTILQLHSLLLDGSTRHFPFRLETYWVFVNSGLKILNCIVKSVREYYDDISQHFQEMWGEKWIERSIRLNVGKTPDCDL